MSERFCITATLIANWIWGLLNSNFFTALAGALAGAFAGAYAAQLIVERSARKQRLLEEIRNTNAAINDAFHVMTVVCTIKAQLIAPLMTGYNAQREAHEAFTSTLDKIPVDVREPYHLDVNFPPLPLIPATIKTLQQLLFDKLSVSGRPLSLLSYLSLSIEDANTAIQRRNQIISYCKSQSTLSDDDLARIYFGLPDRAGHVDTSYPDTMKSISDNVDNCIFFSKTLAEDLIEHGLRICREFGRGSPKIHKADLTRAEKAGLIPNSALYEDWLRMHTF